VWRSSTPRASEALAEQLDSLSTGKLDMFSAATDWLEQVEPSLGVANLPFLFWQHGTC